MDKNNPLIKPDKRDFFISRIVAGFYYIHFPSVRLRLYPPSREVEYESAEIYVDVYENAYDSGILTKEESYDLLFEKNIWTERNEKDIEEAPKNIDKLKMELYKAAFKSNTRREIRKKLEITRNEYDRLYIKKNSLAQYTCEGLATYAKWNYVVENSTYCNDNKYDWQDITLNHVITKYNSMMLTSDEIRELSHNEPWSSLWSIKKKNYSIFPEPWSSEQKALISWSMLYDSVHDSPDCPDESIVNDDDMLDGWLLIQRDIRKKDQAKKHGEESIAQNEKIKNAGELFIPVESEEDVDSVNSLNDARARRTRKRRLAQIANQGTVKHGSLHDVVEEVKMAATRQQFRKDRRG